MVLSVYSLMISKLFGALLLKKTKSKLLLASWNYFLILKILTVTLVRDPTVTILTLEMPVILKNHTESRLRKKVLTYFHCNQCVVDAGEHWPVTLKGILGRVPVSSFKITVVSNKIFLWNMTKAIYPSRDTVPLAYTFSVSLFDLHFQLRLTVSICIS